MSHLNDVLWKALFANDMQAREASERELYLGSLQEVRDTIAVKSRTGTVLRALLRVFTDGRQNSPRDHRKSTKGSRGAASRLAGRTYTS